MPTRGIKRKSPEWEESVLDGHLSFQSDRYTFFRQSLLNMSLEKFNKGRMMVEPSLRRYVLIANTLRVIQEDIRYESLCPLPAMEDEIPGICELSTGNVISSILPPDLENILPSIEDDFSVSAAIATILKELESVLDESCPQSLQRPFVNDAEAKAESVNQVGSRVPILAAQTPSNYVDAMKEEFFNTNSSTLGDAREIELIKELVLAASCSENLPGSAPDAVPELPTVTDTSVPIKASSHSNGEAPVAMDTSNPEQMKSEVPADNSVLTVPAEELRPSEAVFGSFEFMNSSYLNDISLDDPFSDIDTSVFERESQSIGSSLSTRLSASEEHWFSSSCSSPSYSSSQGMRETNDLDNIIEILVGS